MISPGGLVATLFKSTGAAVAAAVDAAFNYVSLLLNGEPPTGTSTFLTDASTNNLGLTSVGSPRPDTFSPFAGDGYYSVQFNGSTDYMALTSVPFDLSTSSSYTIEFWGYSTGGNAYIYQNYNNAPVSNIYGQYISFGGGSVAFSEYNGSSSGAPQFSVGANALSNQWVHVAIVKNGTGSNNISLYVNGILSAQSTLANNVAPNDSSTFIGARSYGGVNGYYSGYISNFRVVKGTAVYTSNFTVPTGPLTAISGTSFLAFQSSKIIDKSTNAYSIGIGGTPKVTYNAPNGSKLGSVKFNGTSDYLTSPAITSIGTGNFTFEANILVTGVTSTSPTLFGLGTVNAAGSLSVFFSDAANVIYCRIGGSGDTYTGAVTLLNTWNHIAVVRNSGVISIYVNGVAQSVTSTGAAGNITATTPTIARQTGFTGAGGFFTGCINNLRFGATALYTSTFTPSTSPLSAVSGTALLTCQGNVVDNSTNALTLTVTGTPSASYASPFPQALTLPTTYGSVYFNGATDYLTSPASTAVQLGAGDFTVECWVNTGGASTQYGYQVAGTYAGVGSGWAILTNRAASVAGISFVINGGILLAFTGYIATNTWYHVAVVRSGTGTNNTVLYVNGANVSQISYNTADAFSGPLYIGNQGGGQYYPGYISNLRIVKSAVYTSAFTPSATPLTAVANTSLLTLQTPTPASTKAVIDYGQFDNAVTVTGTPGQGTFSPFSQSGWSGYFTGSSSYIATPTGLNTAMVGFAGSNWTIEYWVQPTISGTTLGGVLGAYDPVAANGRWWTGYTSNGTVTNAQFSYTITTGSQVDLVTTTALVPNQWNHIAVTINATTASSSTITMYINGVGQTFTAQNMSSQTVNYKAPMIGGNIYAAVTTGYLSNLRMVKGSLVYTGNFTPPTSPLTAVTGTLLLTLQNNNFVDNSSNKFALVATNATVQATSPFEPATAWSSAVNGSSVYLNGTTDWLQMPAGPAFAYGTGDFTIEGWVYLTSLPSAAPLLFGQNVSGTNYVDLFISATGQVQYWGNNTQINGPANTLKIGQWGHAAVVRSNGVVTVYCDGVAGTPATHTTNYTDLTYPPTVGRYSHQATQWLPGYISDLRVVNGTAVYTKAFTPPTAPLQPIPGTSFLLKGTPGFVDATGKNDITTLGNITTTTANKKYGTSSFYIPGVVGSYISTPIGQSLNLGGGDFTIELWYNQTARLYNYPAIFSNYNSYTTGSLSLFAGHLSGSTTLYQLGVNGATFPVVQSTTAITPGTWQHLAVVRSGNTLTLYVNGVANGSTSVAGITFPGVGGIFTVGQSLDNLAQAICNGYIDDFRVTKGAARYTANFTPPTAALGTH